MVDLELLKKRGIDKKSLAKKLTGKNLADGPKKLVETLTSQVRVGLEKSWREARVWRAIDDAYDAPMDQTKWSFVQNLSKKKLNAQALTEELIDFGLTHLLRKYCTGCGVPVVNNGTPAGLCSTGCTSTSRVERMDLPAFFDVVVGLIPAYVKMRWAKIFNDRDAIPFYRYDPLKLTLKGKIKGDIVTDRVDMMATQFDYRSDRRQKIFQTLLYGQCLQVIQEEWYKETQVILEDGKERDYIVKEGLRYLFPHPTKYFWDESHRLSTLNTNTGIKHFGHWYLTTWGEIRDDPAYFNQDIIKYTDSDWITAIRAYSNYYPCVTRWPDMSSVKPNEREASYIYYGTRGTEEDEDMSIVLCNAFRCLQPSRFGLGDYDEPVWFRFVMASHDTVVYAAPMPYSSPASAYLYDHDGNRSRNASMATEVAPFQSVISNYFSQLLFSVHQNLTRVVGYNVDMITEQTIQKMQGLNGERLFRGVHYLPYSGKENTWAQKDITQAFYTPNFPQHNIAEIIQGIQTAINILERVLQFSSQELGVAASHEQSATESTIIHQNMGDRLKFSAGFIDDGENSDKRRLYEGIMAYSDDEMFAQVAELNDTSRAALKEMGWEVEEEAVPGKTKAGIKGDKSTLRLENWASNREGTDRINMAQVGNTMVQLVQAITQNPLVFQALGPQQVIDTFNEVFTYLGLPKDFRLHVAHKVDTTPPEQQAADLQKQVAEIAAKVSSEQIGQFSQMVGEKVIQPMQKGLSLLVQKAMEAEKMNQVQDAALKEVATHLAEIEHQIAPPAPPMMDPGMMAPPGMPPGMPPDQSMLPPPPAAPPMLAPP